MTTNETIKATINERGNGFPEVGDYVGGGGNLYLIVSIDSPIHTGGAPGAPNYVHATVSLADWSDCEESDEGPGEVVVGEDDA